MLLKDSLEQYIKDLEGDILVSMAEYANNQRVVQDLREILDKSTA